MTASDLLSLAGARRSQAEQVWHRYACELIATIRARIGVDTVSEQKLREAVLHSSFDQLRIYLQGTDAEWFLISRDFLGSVRARAVLELEASE